MVGANTVRRDDPRLLVRSQQRQQERISRGETPHPAKVALTASGDLDPTSRFFTVGDTAKIVYAASSAVGKLREVLGESATVVDSGEPVALPRVLADLAERGVRRLMVEGGGRVHTRFLTEGLADELHLAI